MKPDQALRTEIDKLLKDAKLGGKDRSNLYALCGYMAEQDSDTPYEHFLVMYLSNDRDWRKDYASVFGSPIKKRSGENFDLSRVQAAKITKKR